MRLLLSGGERMSGSSVLLVMVTTTEARLRVGRNVEHRQRGIDIKRLVDRAFELQEQRGLVRDIAGDRHLFEDRAVVAHRC